MKFFKNNDSKEAFGICYSCQSPIFDGIWRQLQLKDKHGEDFSLNYHYFPPCFVRGDVLIPENCDINKIKTTIHSSEMLEFIIMKSAMITHGRILTQILGSSFY